MHLALEKFESFVINLTILLTLAFLPLLNLLILIIVRFVVLI